jgi:nucleobase:cation symporter-1, NCS1 family
MQEGSGTPAKMATEGGLEVHGHDYIPLNERHGKARNLFYLWFGENMTIFALVTGALGISLGLNFWWTCLAIILGTLGGSLIMAFHSAQGPTLGLPQMIQSRAQFGYFGALLPTFIAWGSYICFLAVAIVITGQSFQSVWGGELNVWIILSTVAIWILAIVGYDLIHLTLKYLGAAFLVFFAIVLVMLIAHGIPTDSLNHGEFTFPTFMAATAIMATWNAGYAPYVSDYSRYLPPDQVKGTFLYTYVGTSVSTIAMMVLGAAIAALWPDLAVVDAISQLAGGSLGTAMVIIMALGLIVANSTNAYGGGITGLSMIDNVRAFKSTVWTRIAACTVVSIIAIVVATWGAGDFYTNLTNFFFFLLYALIPWSMINLVDFFIIRHGHYRISDFFDRNGGFGYFGWTALICYAISFAAEMPFVNSAWFVGPAVSTLGGADIAWIVGVVVSVPLYYFAVKLQHRGPAEEVTTTPPAE